MALSRDFSSKQARADYVAKRLAELYPETPIPLAHRDAYTLLVAVVLSAQSTDVGVNKVTPRLWAGFGDTPAELAQASVQEIREIIRPVG
jgi:endonuclease-3